MNPLVLSLFPGIGLLDMAFEEEGFCVVRGPDLLWGGDIRRFHPPSGKFDGVIGGPPCQAFSPLRLLVEHNGYRVAENMIPEFARCVAEASPAWFLMENVPAAPTPAVSGYAVRDTLVRDVHVGGESNRLRRFSFGHVGNEAVTLSIQWSALCRPDPMPTALASGFDAGGRRGRQRANKAAALGYKTLACFGATKRAQGLADDYDLPGLTVAAKVKAVGNGVPLAMGRAVAKAVRRAMVQ